MVSTTERLTVPLSWPGRLMNSGTGVISSMLLRFTLRRSNWPFLNETPWSATDHHQRVVVDAELVEAVEHLAELVVGESGLEQVAQLQLLDLALVLVALARDLRDRLAAVAAVLAPVGQVLPRHVGQQHVLEVEGRALLAGSSRSTPRSGPCGRSRGSRACPAGSRPAARTAAPRRPRRHRSRPTSPTRSAGPPRCRVARRRGRTPSTGPWSSTSAGRRTARRAGRPRRGRAGTRVVASSDTFIVWLLPSSVKMLFGCVGGGGQPAVDHGQVAVHDRRHRAAGGVVDRVGVLEEGGVLGEPREVRVALRVDRALRVRAGRCSGTRRTRPSPPARAPRPSADFALASSGITIFDTSEKNRNRTRNRTGAGLSTLRNERTGSARR